MQIRFIIFLGAAVTLSLTACKKENEEDLIRKQGGITCDITDTSKVTFSATVLPILQNNCYSCHAGPVLIGSVSLEGYDKVKIQADNNNLINVITHAPGYPAMPQNLPKLSDCDINAIRLWIKNGTPQ